MVEKIDRPEAPPAYRITEAKGMKESLHQGERQQDDEQERFQKTSEEKAWGKFHTKTITIRPAMVKRDRIASVRFRAVALRNGTAMLVGDILWKNGQVTDEALFLLPRLEDYFRLKGLRQGDEISESFWAHGEEIEIGIPQEIGASGKFHALPEEKKPEGRVNEKTNHIQWKFVIALMAAVVVIAIALWQELQ